METPRVRAPLVAIVILPRECVGGDPLEVPQGSRPVPRFRQARTRKHAFPLNTTICWRISVKRLAIFLNLKHDTSAHSAMISIALPLVGMEIGATAHRRRLCPKDAIERLSGAAIRWNTAQHPRALAVGSPQKN